MDSTLIVDSKSKSLDVSDSKHDLLIEVDYPLPFNIDSSTSIEIEIESSIKQFMSMLKSYLFRIVLITIALIVVLFFQGLLMLKSDTYYMTTNRIPLLDRIHELLEDVNHPFTPAMCNIFMFTIVWAGILRIILFTPLFYLFEMALRYIFLFGTAYFIRGFFIFATTIPSCYYNCNPDLKKRSFFPLLIRIISGYMGIATNCTDLIVSGHTMFTVITCILFVENAKYLITKLILVLYTGFVLFLIVACKYHYTVDVLLGLSISILLHFYYYSRIDDFGTYTHNKIFNYGSESFIGAKKTKLFYSPITRFLVRMEMLEEKMILGQKLRALYLRVNDQKSLIDKKLLKKFNHFVRLFGADESDDLLTLYRGTRNMNFYYWKYLYRKMFKKKKIVEVI
uniref:Putative transmembrane protein 6TMP n=1 Tax=Theileria annulata TaxID=5874 RepID=Q56H32_THEAN|nr:putative transmembrane protein 6TMP [Theileria annulata]